MWRFDSMVPQNLNYPKIPVFLQYIYIYSMQLLTTCITIQFLHCFTDLFINVYDLFISETSFCDRHKDRVSVQASGLTVRTDMELVWDKRRQQSLSKDFDNIDTGIETLFTPSNNTYKWQLPAGLPLWHVCKMWRRWQESSSNFYLPGIISELTEYILIVIFIYKLLEQHKNSEHRYR